MSKPEVAWLVNELKISPNKLQNKETGFDDRLRVQKAAYLLNYLEIPSFMGFNFDMYLNGPYSSQLSHDYYSLNEVRPEEPRNLAKNERDQMLWFVDHDSKWLEIASSILLIKSEDKDTDTKSIFPILRVSKPWVEEKVYYEIVKEMAAHNLIR